MISHTAANSVKVVAEGLAGDHGETDERPMPLPSATRSKVLATAVSAPPITAAQETADGEAGPSSTIATVPSGAVGSAMLRSNRQMSASRMMIGIGTPSSQSSMPRPISGPPKFVRPAPRHRACVLVTMRIDGMARLVLESLYQASVRVTRGGFPDAVQV